MLRAAALLCLSAALGLWLAPRIAWRDDWHDAGRTASRAAIVLLLAIGTVLQVWVVLRHGQRIGDTTAPIAAVDAASRTWVGRVLIAQSILMLVAMLVAWAPWHQGTRWLLPSAVVLAWACVALSGHIVAGGQSRWRSAAALAHVLGAGVWVAALPALLYAWRRAPAHAATRALRQFSRIAGPLMALLLASGLLLAEVSVARWAALLVTDYGQRLLLKLALLGAALACAMHLRRWLRQAASPSTRLPIAVLAAEWLLACGVVAAAGMMAALVPAAHDRIDWPFTFRLSPSDAAKQRPDEVDAAWLAMVLAALGALFGCAALVRQRRRALGLFVLAGGIACSVALAVSASRVEAYPTTYAAAQAPYTADSIAQGAKLYGLHCMGCHGAHGQGNGPLAASLPKRPANLTEPHVGWHTHGDLFWWLSNGMPSGAMPGFAQQIDSAGRWHLINRLTAMSLGFQARNLGVEPARLDPWLAAIDFSYARADGETISLADWRKRSAVLLVFAFEPAHLPRVKALLVDAARIPARLIAVLPGALRESWQRVDPPAGEDADIVIDDAGQIIAAWKNYRRTLANPDFRDDAPPPAGLEFLIDRFGFVRARWRSDEGVAALSVDQLAAVFDALAREPELKSPDVHAH